MFSSLSVLHLPLREDTAQKPSLHDDTLTLKFQSCEKQTPLLYKIQSRAFCCNNPEQPEVPGSPVTSIPAEILSTSYVFTIIVISGSAIVELPRCHRASLYRATGTSRGPDLPAFSPASPRHKGTAAPLLVFYPLHLLISDLLLLWILLSWNSQALGQCLTRQRTVTHS